MLMIPFALWFGFLNCARGRKLFNTTTSTEVSRLIATLGMVLATGALLMPNVNQMGVVTLWTWATLMLWCSSGWDALWSAAIGDDLNHSRLWGLGALTLRMTLAAPCLIGLAWLTGHSYTPITGVLLLGLPYYISGYITPRKYVISAAESVTGMLLGGLVYLMTF